MDLTTSREGRSSSRRLGFAGSAEAANPYAGLSSEFAYFDQQEPPCFGFAAPKPTRTEYLDQSVDYGAVFDHDLDQAAAWARGHRRRRGPDFHFVDTVRQWGCISCWDRIGWLCP